MATAFPEPAKAWRWSQGGPRRIVHHSTVRRMAALGRARFTEADVRAAGGAGNFTRPEHPEFSVKVLLERQGMVPCRGLLQLIRMRNPRRPWPTSHRQRASTDRSRIRSCLHRARMLIVIVLVRDHDPPVQEHAHPGRKVARRSRRSRDPPRPSIPTCTRVRSSSMVFSTSGCFGGSWPVKRADVNFAESQADRF